MENVITVHTDGGSRGNPGPAAIGVVIKRDGKVFHKFGKTIGEATNNVAEYTAVIEALHYIKSVQLPNNDSRLIFYLDSKLVVEQLNGTFKIKDGKLRELAFQIKVLEQDVGGGVSYFSIPRENNREADLLVNFALDKS